MQTFYERDYNIQAGERVKLARKKLGYTQKDFAKMLGVSPDRLCKYEYGKILVPAWVLIVAEKEAAHISGG
jgi:transcriptional regulator with XRE-family HTH domain